MGNGGDKKNHTVKKFTPNFGGGLFFKCSFGVSVDSRRAYCSSEIGKLGWARLGYCMNATHLQCPIYTR